MEQEQIRKIAMTSGAAAIVVAILVFFFGQDSTAAVPVEQRVIAALVGIAVSIVGLRLYFAKFKFKNGR